VILPVKQFDLQSNLAWKSDSPGKQFGLEGRLAWKADWPGRQIGLESNLTWKVDWPGKFGSIKAARPLGRIARACGHSCWLEIPARPNCLANSIKSSISPLNRSESRSKPGKILEDRNK
jgi:hypothetical protein